MNFKCEICYNTMTPRILHLSYENAFTLCENDIESIFNIMYTKIRHKKKYHICKNCFNSVRKINFNNIYMNSHILKKTRNI